MLSHWFLVALGGAVGAVLRFYLSETLPSETFPWATLSVNLVGSFLLGIVMAATLVDALGETEALLLEILSDYQVSIPELVAAKAKAGQESPRESAATKTVVV